MSRYLVVHPRFEWVWSQVPADLGELWSRDGDVSVVRLDEDDDRPLSAVPDDPLLGRENVVHTSHVDGRTPDANREWARMLLARFADA